MEISLPYNIVAVPNDYFYTGAYYLTSGIKTSYYNTDAVPEKIDNITAYVSCDQNIFDKSLDLKAIVKWDAVQTTNPLTFETYVYEDGVDNASYIFNSTPISFLDAIKIWRYRKCSLIRRNCTFRL